MEAVKVVKRKASTKAIAKRASLPPETGSDAVKSVIRRRNPSSSTGKKPIKTATVPETAGDLRETFPHYAAAFDQASSDGKSVSLAEACTALSQTLASSSSASPDELPWSEVETVFATKQGGRGRIDLGQFCELVREMKVAQANVKLKPMPTQSEEDPNIIIGDDGMVFFTGYKEDSPKAEPKAEPKAGAPAPAKPTPQKEYSPSEIAAFALKTTILPKVIQKPKVYKYKLTDWRTIRQTFSRYSVPCGKLQFSIDGSQLAATFMEGTAELYAVEEFSSNLPGAAGLSKEAWARVSGDATALLASGSKKTFGERNSAMNNLRWTHVNSGRHLMTTVDTRGGLALWEMPRARSREEPRLLNQVLVGFGSPLNALAFSRDTTTVFTAGVDRYVYVYDVEYMSKLCFTQRLGGEAMVTLEGGTLENIGGVVGHTDRVQSLCSHPFSPQVVFSAGQDKNVLMWDMRQGNDRPNIITSGTKFQGDTMDISADGTRLLTGSHEYGNSLLIHEIRMPYKGQAQKPLKTFSWSGDEDPFDSGRYHTQSLLNAVGWDAFENRFIIAGGQQDNLARVFEIPDQQSRKPLHVISTLESDKPITSMAISGSGESVAVGMQDGSIQFARIERVME